MELELSIAIVGVRFANADGTSREDEVRRCTIGERVDLVPEPTNEHDPRAVAAFSARGVQLGYISAERCGYIGGKIASGEPCEAIFQQVEPPHAGEPIGVIWVRARIGGGAPTLPAGARYADPPARTSSRPPRREPGEFYPDPDPPMWGA